MNTIPFHKLNTGATLMVSETGGWTPYYTSMGAAVVEHIKHNPDPKERVDPEYRSQCRAEVKEKIREGLIHIGTPPNKPGLMLIAQLGHWAYFKIFDIEIQGRTWKSPTTGTTYHVARVLLNHRHVWTSGMQVGGGWQFETTGLKWLRESGHLPASDSLTDPMGVPDSVIRRLFRYNAQASEASRRKTLLECRDWPVPNRQSTEEFISELTGEDPETCFDCGDSIEWTARGWKHVGENRGCFMDPRNAVLETEGGA